MDDSLVDKVPLLWVGLGQARLFAGAGPLSLLSIGSCILGIRDSVLAAVGRSSLFLKVRRLNQHWSL